MDYYFSRTGTAANLKAAREAGFGILVSRAGVWRTEGFADWVGDNGAWADFQANRPFDEDEFERFLDWIAAQPVPPRWIVLPDIVAGGQESLRLSLRYTNRCLSVAPLVLIAVQDGIEPADVEPHVGPRVGIFLGGSDEWKLARMKEWGDWCRDREVYYHVARANTEVRLGMAAGAHAHSGDGSSATRYLKTVPLLKRAVERGRRYQALVARKT